jgi:PAS domain-containing protein
LIGRTHTTKGFLQSVLDGIPERVLLQDRDHNIVWANKQAIEAFGKAQDEVLDTKCHVLLLGSNSPCLDCPAEKAIATGEAADSDVPSKGDKRYHLWAYPVKLNDKRTEQVLTVVRDVTVIELERKAKVPDRIIT